MPRVNLPIGPHRVLATGRYLELVDEGGWEYVRRPAATGVAVIVATTEARELVLVEQPRIPVHRRTIELPAGLVGDLPSAAGEPLEAAAARELEEETGFRAAHWSRLIEGPTAVGASAEVVTFFRATALERVSPGGGDHTEDITVHVIPVAGVPAFLAAKAAAGALVDPKVYAALHFVEAEARPSRPASAAAPRDAALVPKLGVAQPGPVPFVPRLADDGRLVWEYTVDPAHHNPHGALHGGVVMTLLDTAMGWVVAQQIHGAGRLNAAAQMSTTFLVPVRSGTIRASARIVKLGKRLAVVEATAVNDAGEPIAIASATHALLP